MCGNELVKKGNHTVLHQLIILYFFCWSEKGSKLLIRSVRFEYILYKSHSGFSIFRECIGWIETPLCAFVNNCVQVEESCLEHRHPKTTNTKKNSMRVSHRSPCHALNQKPGHPSRRWCAMFWCLSNRESKAKTISGWSISKYVIKPKFKKEGQQKVWSSAVCSGRSQISSLTFCPNKIGQGCW